MDGWVKGLITDRNDLHVASADLRRLLLRLLKGALGYGCGGLHGTHPSIYPSNICFHINGWTHDFLHMNVYNMDVWMDG